MELTCILTQDVSYLPAMHTGARLYLLIYAMEDVMDSPLLPVIASSPVISIIGSCNSIHAQLKWDVHCAAMRWRYYRVNTRVPHDLTPDMKVVVTKGKAIAPQRRLADASNEDEGLKFVLTSVTRKHRDMLRCLLQLMAREAEEDKEKSGSSVAWMNLMRACKEALIVKSDPDLRTLVNELVDHRLLKHYRDEDACWRIALLIAHNDLSSTLASLPN